MKKKVIKIQKLFCIFFVALSMIGFSNMDVRAEISPPQHLEVSGGRKQTEQTKTFVEFRFTFDLVSFDGRNGTAVYDVGSYFIFDGRTIALTDHLYINGGYIGSFTSLNGYHNKGTYYRTEKFRVTLHEGNNYLNTKGDSGVGGETNIRITVPKFQNYRVNFIDWDSTLLKSEQVFKGDNATPPSQPTRTGYDFTGWLGNYRNVTEDRTIQATYTKKKYNVRFDSVGGSYVPSQEVEYQNRVSYPSNPTRSSDKFMGWYTTLNYQQGYDFNSLVSSSFTLYAKWDKVPSITA
ncbi:MAG: InlB B-repeat-containing protein, partial [Longicatena sp.]